MAVLACAVAAVWWTRPPNALRTNARFAVVNSDVRCTDCACDVRRNLDGPPVLRSDAGCAVSTSDVLTQVVTVVTND